MPQKLYEAASDCICSALYMCEDSPSYYSLAQVLQVEVQKLQSDFQSAVQSEDVNRYNYAYSNFVPCSHFEHSPGHHACAEYLQKWQKHSFIT